MILLLQNSLRAQSSSFIQNNDIKSKIVISPTRIVPFNIKHICSHITYYLAIFNMIYLNYIDYMSYWYQNASNFL